MSARRSSGVQRARGGSAWRRPPTSANSVPRASLSRVIVCQSPPFSVARQKHWGEVGVDVDASHDLPFRNA